MRCDSVCVYTLQSISFPPSLSLIIWQQKILSSGTLKDKNACCVSSMAVLRPHMVPSVLSCWDLIFCLFMEVLNLFLLKHTEKWDCDTFMWWEWKGQTSSRADGVQIEAVREAALNLFWGGEEEYVTKKPHSVAGNVKHEKYAVLKVQNSKNEDEHLLSLFLRCW